MPASHSHDNKSGPIFISYATKDALEFAMRLHDALERLGIDAWLDKHDIKVGDPWDELIWQAIDRCILFVCIITPGSRDSSVCREEFERAQNMGKRMAPILFLPTDPMPTYLPQRMQYIDYIKRGEREMLAELRVTRDNVLLPPRSPDAIRAAEEKATADALSRPMIANFGSSRTYKPNPLPPKSFADFQDRAKQRADINSYLAAGDGLISVYGQGGVGKTALAVEVLTELEASPNPPDLIVVLRETRANAHTLADPGISVERIFLDTARALGGVEREQIEAIWTGLADLARKCQALVAALSGKRCILLIDNSETLQDPVTHELLSPDLLTYLETTLPLQGAPLVLMTSRERIKLPASLTLREKLVPLSEGLPAAEAIAMLTSLDDGTERIKNAPHDTLKLLVEQVKGFPRALEYLAAWLKRDPTLTLDNLLTSPALLSQEVTHALAHEAFKRLPPAQMRVLEGLALYGRPSTLSALQYLLAPYLDSAQIHSLLLRLMEAYFVAYNPATSTYAMHPLDIDYCKARIPTDAVPNGSSDALPYTYKTLLERAGDYFRSIRLPAAEIGRLKTIDALDPQLTEFGYRVAAGDFDTAADILAHIDFDYLLLWGHAQRVVELDGSLVDHIADKKLRGTSLGHLGQAYAHLGQLERAIGLYKQQLAIAREIGDRWGEGNALGNLGIAFYSLGQAENAIDLYEQWLTIAREIGNRQGEGAALGSLGRAYARLRQVERAISFYQQGLEIAREIGDRRGEAAALGSLGRAYNRLGQVEQAISFFQQALEIAREIGDRRGEGDDLSNLGLAYIRLGQVEYAIDLIEQQLVIVREIGNLWGEGAALSNLGSAYEKLGQADKALALFRQALVIRKNIGNPQSIDQTERDIQRLLGQGTTEGH